MLKFLNSYIEHIENNVMLYKTNIIDITNNYIIMQKNINANYIQIFKKSASIMQINEEILNKYIKDVECKNVIIDYFKTIGSNEYDFEIQKIKNLKTYLLNQITKAKDELKNKGGLYFKIALAIGAVVAICVW